MRKILATLLALATLSASAQQTAQQPVPPPPAGSNWQHVQMLPKGTSIYVYSRTSHQRCDLAAIDADTLTCVHGKDIVFQRTGIASIKLAHRGRSSLVGLAIGAGAGIGIGYGIAASHADTTVCGLGCVTVSDKPISKPIYSAMGALLGATVGTLTGYFTDFTRSTVYKAP